MKTFYFIFVLAMLAAAGFAAFQTFTMPLNTSGAVVVLNALASVLAAFGAVFGIARFVEYTE